jgi:hypothetical protein
VPLQGDYGAQEIVGAIFETQLDLSHPLILECQETMPIFRNTSISLNLIKIVTTTLFNTKIH